MRKIFTIHLCVLLLILLTAALNGTPDTDQEVIIGLLNERIGILNHFYGDKMALEDAKNNIAKITSDTLMEEDIRMMQALYDTEIDQITDFNVEMISCERMSYGIIKGEVKIHWSLFGQSGHWQTVENYYFTAEDDQGKVKLTQLKKL